MATAASTPTDARRRLIVALDFDRLALAAEMARRLEGAVGMFKIGFQLFTAAGPTAVERISRYGSIFLDLKFHDIPNTVAGAVSAAAALPGVELLNIHALGGLPMMRAAEAAVARLKNPPKLVAVTVLTSHDAASLQRVGVAGTPATRALKLAALTKLAGLDGVICSPRECAAIRRACGEKFLLVVGGIRPAGAARNDQARTATPREAILNGADYLFVGRPIISAPKPAAAAQAIVREMGAAVREA